jgi:hypothetical protein
VVSRHVLDETVDGDGANGILQHPVRTLAKDTGLSPRAVYTAKQLD